MPLSESIAAELDQTQADAIRAFGPRTLVVAGAGSGKTRVLTYGLAHLIQDLGHDPNQLMLLTFTRKAAAEMSERAADVVGTDLDGLACGTFHAVGADLMRAAGREFSVIDEYEAELMVAQLGAELMEQREMEDAGRLDPSRVYGFFAQAREEDLDLDEVLADAPEAYRDQRSLLHELADRFTDRKQEERLLDYTDLLYETRALLAGEHGPGVRESLRAVLVDEVQDLNQMQRDIIELLITDGAWLVMVGDAEQSIYGWRGASYDALLTMADEPDVTVVKLETNYRSAEEIVELARALTPDTKLALRSHAHRGAGGQRPKILSPDDPGDETAQVARWADQRLEGGASAEDLCVLARAHDHLRDLHAGLTNAGFAVALMGRRRGEVDNYIQFMRALMRLTLAPHDRAAWQRVLPSFGFEVEEQHERLQDLMSADDPLGVCAQSVPDPDVAAVLSQAAQAKPSASLWSSLCLGPLGRALSAAAADPTQAASLLTDLQQAGDAPGEGAEYLSALSLDGAGAELGSGIRLGTIHASKGLEWPHVLVLRASYDAFPSRLSVAEGRLDEERRLFYVAVTRAEDTLVISQAPWLAGGASEHDLLVPGSAAAGLCEPEVEHVGA